MAEERSPFICVSCRTFTADVHCANRGCDWLVCQSCESVISDVDHRVIATRDRFLRELSKSQHPSSGGA